MKTAIQAVTTSIIGFGVFLLMVFLPAGTFHYWQGWAFIAVFAAATMIPSVYLAATNPAALQRRMQAGPAAESRPLQKIIITFAFVSMGAMIVVSALDYRYGWSSVPAVVSVIGDVLVGTGLLIAMITTIQNGYAAANINVESDQNVVSTGVYSVVRHPMYFGNVVMMIGVPLALGSYWALLFVVPGLAVLATRILDEEKALTLELTGYREYIQRVHYRLVPGVW
jgi:protein-S-isoprenylcysteine O-methyltransferase Ste14